MLKSSTVITYVPERPVPGLRPGDRIQPTVEQVQRLAAASFAELESRFVEEPAAWTAGRPGRIGCATRIQACRWQPQGIQRP
ncbi:MAG: hypothetical protein JWR66_3214 [Modestobacter sp.]|nr:hypothetical protein [Modestobacter sp.]